MSQFKHENHCHQREPASKSRRSFFKVKEHKSYLSLRWIFYKVKYWWFKVSNGGFWGREEKSASQGKRETCACLKLSVRIVSGEKLADLLNNSDPVWVVEAGNLWWDLQDLGSLEPCSPYHFTHHCRKLQNNVNADLINSELVWGLERTVSCIVDVMWRNLLWLHSEKQHAATFYFSHTGVGVLNGNWLCLDKKLFLPPCYAIYCQQQKNAGASSALSGPWCHQCCCDWYSEHKEIPVQRCMKTGEFTLSLIQQRIVDAHTQRARCRPHDHI